MKVFIDGSSLLRKSDGVGRYTKEIYSRLDNVSILTYSDTDDFGYTNFVRISLPRRVYYAIYKLLWRMPVNSFLKDKPDVMIYPNFIRVPMVKDTPYILVVHDLAYLHTPKYVRTRNLAYLKKHVPKSIHEASLIIVVSETTKEDIVSNFDVSPEKILVAPNAVDVKQFSNISSNKIAQVKDKYGTSDEYFLFVGTIEPRKNIINILAAYEKLGTSMPPLVLAGGEGWKNEEMGEKIAELQSQGFRIVLTGFVDDVDLPAIYAGAKLLIFPSHFEGFGIPILEAQASGIPVITSNRDPMKEVAGDGAVLVDPDDVDDIAGAITRLHKDDELQKDLIAKGKENIKRYNWDESAKVFKDAIKVLSK